MAPLTPVNGSGTIKSRNKENAMHRHPVNKGKSAHQFRNNTRRTKAANMKGAPMRGGIRL